MKKTIITLLVVAAVVITVIIIALADSSRRIHQGNDNEWLKLKEIAERLQLNVQEVRIRHWILYRCKVDSVVDDLGHLDIWGLYICRASSLLSRPTLT